MGKIFLVTLITLFSFEGVLASFQQANLKHLREAKYFLINGDLKKTRFHLDQIEDPKAIEGIVMRYKALIDFLTGQYVKSDKILREKKYESTNWNTETCVIKTLNNIALSNYEQIQKDYITCKYLTFDYSKNRQLWLDYLVNLKLRKDSVETRDSEMNLRIFFDDLETIKIWLKKNIYINKESQNIEKLYALPKYAFKNKAVRELVGLSYYRMGNEKKALDFIEDLDSPNANNIKGIINLSKKKYELAFGHFQLALKKKANSGNALKRAIPLAWMMEKYDIGLSLLKSFFYYDIDRFKQLALESAFKIQLERIKEAEKDLRYLNNEFSGNMPLKVMLANSYVSLRLSHMKDVKKYATLACKKFDGLNCWVWMQLFVWKNLDKVIKENRETKNAPSLTMDFLKKKPDFEPLDENPIIDQSYIEELDSNQVMIKEE